MNVKISLNEDTGWKCWAHRWPYIAAIPTTISGNKTQRGFAMPFIDIKGNKATLSSGESIPSGISQWKLWQQKIEASKSKQTKKHTRKQFSLDLHRVILGLFMYFVNRFVARGLRQERGGKEFPLKECCPISISALYLECSLEISMMPPGICFATEKKKM